MAGPSRGVLLVHFIDPRGEHSNGGNSNVISQVSPAGVRSVHFLDDAEIQALLELIPEVVVLRLLVQIVINEEGIRIPG